eukprot:scaffold6648_cov63-Phaeocystis_antarctica.AAC.6
MHRTMVPPTSKGRAGNCAGGHLRRRTRSARHQGEPGERCAKPVSSAPPEALRLYQQSVIAGPHSRSRWTL